MFVWVCACVYNCVCTLYMCVRMWYNIHNIDDQSGDFLLLGWALLLGASCEANIYLLTVLQEAVVKREKPSFGHYHQVSTFTCFV